MCRVPRLVIVPAGKSGAWGKMDTDLEKAQHYRNQAIHIRELAANETEDSVRKALVSLSETYDRMCQACLERAAKAGAPKA